jgi:SNF2 family DNA or RNA helicase
MTLHATSNITLQPPQPRHVSVPVAEVKNTSQLLESLYGRIKNLTLEDPVEEEKEKEVKTVEYQPEKLLVQLLTYQRLGLKFMLKNEAEDMKPRGGFLFDDMGLGKTVTHALP